MQAVEIVGCYPYFHSLLNLYSFSADIPLCSSIEPKKIELSLNLYIVALPLDVYNVE